MNDLKSELYITVHSARKSVPELADEIGVSTSLLYRYAIEGESGADLPLRRLIPLMRATNDFRVLRHLAARCGFVLVKLPRVAKLKKPDAHSVNEITRKFHQVMAEVLKFFEAPDREQIPRIESALHEHLCEVASLRRAVREFPQPELEGLE